MSSNNIADKIREHISREGPMTFAAFMEMALYGEGGYYTSSSEPIGAAGDYYTSPTAHPVFGALLAQQLEQMWQVLGCPRPFTVVELGAGSGRLAQDILSYVHHLSTDFYDALSYVAVDRGFRNWIAGERVQRVVGDHLPQGNIVGCIFSNELLDALAAHRVVQQNGRLHEAYVDFQQGKFVKVLGNPSTPLLEKYLEEGDIVLAEGQRAEISLGLSKWVEDVSKALDRGFLLTIDYGYTAEELYSPKRHHGTTMGYYRHGASGNPFQHIGQQDITSHVDFSAVIRSGEEHGLAPWGFITQREFLTNLGIRAFINGLAAKNLSQREEYANRMGMQDLIKIDGLGRFKVLLQAKGVTNQKLYGLWPDNPKQQELLAQKETLLIPLLSPEHISLLEGKYPHLAFDFEGLWQ